MEMLATKARTNVPTCQQLHTLFALANLWMARGRLLKNSQSKPGVGA